MQFMADMKNRIFNRDSLPHLHSSFMLYAEPLLCSKTVLSMDKYIQHGDTTCLTHCIAVAFFSYKAAELLRIKYDKQSLIRGALLHDYFLYDWHVKDLSHRMHGFHHPFTALNNAQTDYQLTAIEKDIIVRHMFPLVPIPPKHRESLIVCLVDKYCTLYEMMVKDPYPLL